MSKSNQVYIIANTLFLRTSWSKIHPCFPATCQILCYIQRQPCLGKEWWGGRRGGLGTVLADHSWKLAATAVGAKSGTGDTTLVCPVMGTKGSVRQPHCLCKPWGLLNSVSVLSKLHWGHGGWRAAGKNLRKRWYKPWWHIQSPLYTATRISPEKTTLKK